MIVNIQVNEEEVEELIAIADNLTGAIEDLKDLILELKGVISEQKKMS